MAAYFESVVLNILFKFCSRDPLALLRSALLNSALLNNARRTGIFFKMSELFACASE
jgi:hypothetical protein